MPSKDSGRPTNAPGTPADSGPVDSGPADSGPADSGPADSGPADSGPADSGRVGSSSAGSTPGSPPTGPGAVGVPAGPGAAGPSGCSTVLERVDRFYDAVPRAFARTEDFGRLTLFVGEPGRGGEDWRFYARPAPASARRGGGAGAVGEVTAGEVWRVRARQRELGVPESFEWIDETAPGLREVVRTTGLRVVEHPLMVLDPAAPLPAPDPRARLLSPGDPELPAAMAVPHIGFRHPGTDRGPEGAGSLAAWLREHPDGPGAAGAAARMRYGTKAVAVAGADGVPACSGQYNAVGDTAEVVAVATLPEARRRGLALAVTAVLAAEARARGIATLFLAADSEAVARVYARSGFRRVGLCLTAETETGTAGR